MSKVCKNQYRKNQFRTLKIIGLSLILYLWRVSFCHLTKNSDINICYFLWRNSTEFHWVTLKSFFVIGLILNQAFLFRLFAMWNFGIALYFSIFRPFYKWLLRLVTGRCELLRITSSCQAKPQQTCRIGTS